jgi:4-diphosphocytidyl-2-C-methyl-D-erythritol kinase
VKFSKYRIQAPAKLNLRLKVTGRRTDGYHELVSIMIPVSLFDSLEVAVADHGRINLTCRGFSVPGDENNLVVRAASLFMTQAGIEKGLEIRLTKRIPVAAGMGGGSSDAAATLLVLNTVWAGALSPEALHDLGRQIGADVPFFLYGKPALARGIGDILEPLGDWPDWCYIIVTPPVQISTPWVYGNFQLKKLTRDELEYIKIVLGSHAVNISQFLENDLETVTSATFPIIDTIKKALIEAGAEGALMTGSGPSVFGVFRSLKEAESARKNLISRRLGDVFVARTWTQEESLVIGHLPLNIDH